MSGQNPNMAKDETWGFTMRLQVQAMAQEFCLFKYYHFTKSFSSSSWQYPIGLSVGFRSAELVDQSSTWSGNHLAVILAVWAGVTQQESWCNLQVHCLCWLWTQWTNWKSHSILSILYILCLFLLASDSRTLNSKWNLNLSFIWK